MSVAGEDSEALSAETAWYDAGGSQQPNMPVGGMVKTFSGLLALGSQQAFFDLLNVGQAQTVLIQHILGTGQIYIGNVNTPPPYYEQNWDAAPLGTAYGFDSWVDGLVTGSPQIQDNTMGPILQGIQSVALNADGVNPLADMFRYFAPPGPLPPILVTDGYTCSWNMEQVAAADPGNIFYRAAVDVNGGPVSWQIEVNNNGAGIVTVYDSPAGVLTAHILATTVTPGANNIWKVVVGSRAAGDLPITFFLNNVAIFTGTVGPSAEMIESFHHQWNDTLLTGYTNLWIVDNMTITVPSVTAGILIPDGGGQELNQHGDTPINLYSLGIAVDPLAAAPASVQILVITP